MSVSLEGFDIDLMSKIIDSISNKSDDSVCNVSTIFKQLIDVIQRQEEEIRVLSDHIDHIQAYILPARYNDGAEVLINDEVYIIDCVEGWDVSYPLYSAYPKYKLNGKTEIFSQTDIKNLPKENL